MSETTERMAATAVSDPGSLAVAQWQPFRGPFQRWPRLMDTLLALLSLFMTFAAWSGSAEEGAAITPGQFLALPLALIANFSLVWRRRYPVYVHATVIVCSLLVMLGPVGEGTFAMVFSLYSLGRYAANSRASMLGMLAGLLLAAFDLFVLGQGGSGDIVALGFVVLFWYVGRRLRFRGEYLRLLEERAQYLEQQKTEESARAVAAERTRIARELHDVVAHQISLMTVQAGAAKTVALSDPSAAHGAMSAVEHAGRQAMSEMRHLLDVLRQDHGGSVVPQPGCADLLSLVAEVNSVGSKVTLDTVGRLSGLPAMLDLAVYRIVQEALTNFIKHAGQGASARVSVEATKAGIELAIHDDGLGHGAMPGQGYGIGGMRERAELLGGWLRAAPLPESGFEVRAFLPYGSDAYQTPQASVVGET